MIKKIVVFLILLAAVAAVIAWYLGFTSATRFEGKEKMLYIRTAKTDKGSIMRTLVADSIMTWPWVFEKLASQRGYWEKVKPGRYKIPKGMSAVKILRMLESGKQEPATLVINKLRLKQDLAKVMARYIEQDSAGVMALLNNEDSLRSLGIDSVSLMTAIIPNSYQVIWTWKPYRVLQKLKEERDKWWNNNLRKEHAAKKGLTPDQAQILASIVEEETNKKADKPLVASVYLNRLARGMPLQADPTVRFARRDFLSNRVLYNHLRFPSPYNTYIHTGLPPGPICTPQPGTIESVINAPRTDYIFFVASPDLMGGSVFTSNLKDHNKAAREYQDSLTAWMKRRAAKEKSKTEDASQHLSK